MIARSAAPWLLLVALAAAPQAQAPDPARVDAAVRKGLGTIKAAGENTLNAHQAPELALLAMAHAGVRENDPEFNALLKSMLVRPLQATYRVALQAMVLEEVERVKYQDRIRQCAQFLVDTQSSNGQWSYAHEKIPIPAGDGDTPTVEDPAARPVDYDKVVVFQDPDSGGKPTVRRKITVKRTRTDTLAAGDNSNSQYAALGLRACHDAGILIPKETVEKASKWWRECQIQEPGSPTGPASRGWGYMGRSGSAYGSMSAGAVGALAILMHIEGKDWRQDASLNAGVRWLADHFSVTENPGRGKGVDYYYLYGLERAGMLYGTTKFGKNDWYAEGAATLLQAQAPDGSWGSPVNTSFAILFLKKATRALVSTSDARAR